MAQKLKRKTVKELNDDFNIFEEKFKSMEVLVDLLNAKVKMLEKKPHIMSKISIVKAVTKKENILASCVISNV